MKATVTKVVVERVEGPTVLCGTHTFSTISQANAWLASQSHTFPKGGYDKHDVEVTYSDGETVQIRMDCQHSDIPNNDTDVGKHVREFIEFYAGLWTPGHLTKERHQKLLKNLGEEKVQEFKQFAETHEM